MPLDNAFAFLGGQSGPWRVTRLVTVCGQGLETVARLSVINGHPEQQAPGTAWTLRGLTSHVRYANRAEVDQLQARQPALGRPEARCAALIPICKSDRWWALAQDERRRIFEQDSHHTETGLAYLPAIARRLHHGRDIGEPFDFLTWFEYAPEHADNFERMVAKLRATAEWSFVEREIDIRLVRDEVLLPG
jgi:Chlorite dismutase